VSDDIARPPETIEPESVLDVTVRFWAELGRTNMPLGHAVALAEGSIVDLDRKPEEPVDVYVNGAHFGTGRLILLDGEWALQLDTVALGGVEQVSNGRSETG
jgi:flagellar motor switch protein FliN/FliY